MIPFIFILLSIFLYYLSTNISLFQDLPTESLIYYRIVRQGLCRVTSRRYGLVSNYDSMVRNLVSFKSKNQVWLYTTHEPYKSIRQQRTATPNKRCGESSAVRADWAVFQNETYTLFRDLQTKFSTEFAVARLNRYWKCVLREMRFVNKTRYYRFHSNVQRK